jgi:tetratricopeptide (TPR) repeat protein
MNTERGPRRRCFGPFVAAVAAVAWFALAAAPGGQENLGTGRVSGKVIDERKQPVEGAQIIAQSLTALSTKLDARTDAKGGFVIGGLGMGPWRFTASKSGYQNAVLDVDVHQLRANPPIVIVLKAAEVAAAADGSREAAENVLAQGNTLLAEEKYAEARELLEQFLDGHPDAYQVSLQIGQCGLKLGELDRAEKSFAALLDEILKRSGSYAKEAVLATQALSGLGEAAVKRNDIDAGMTFFRQALEVSPEDEKVAYNVAEIFFGNQKTDEAIQYYLMAIQIRKGWPKPYDRLGLAYLNKGDYVKALEYLRTFVAMDPESPAAAEARTIIAAIERIKESAPIDGPAGSAG